MLASNKALSPCERRAKMYSVLIYVSETEHNGGSSSVAITSAMQLVEGFSDESRARKVAGKIAEKIEGNSTAVHVCTHVFKKD